MKNRKIKSALSSTMPVRIILILISIAMTAGCSDSNLTGIQSAGNNNTSSNEILPDKKTDSTTIRLNLNLKFKSSEIIINKLLESNIGTQFPHIAGINTKLAPGEELNLQELQPYGIFGVFINATGLFTISNTDGMSLTTKTLLLEKCAFIDLKLRNTEPKPIIVKGFVAGE